MGLWNGHPGADHVGPGVERWRTSPTEPSAAPDCLQRLLRSRFRQQVSAGVRLREGSGPATGKTEHGGHDSRPLHAPGARHAGG
jgi:hypothetical protein